jgi:glycosyltransferase involved in cell wall biosynthesis
MLIARGNPLIVMCFTEDDHRFIESLGAPVVPVRLGPADWVDASVFAAPQVEEKTYDLVMVANWGTHKRHAQLFRALRDVRDRDVRVLLCGFAWANRTADDIWREAAAVDNPRVRIEILENVPHAKLAEYVARSKVFVFLTRKEGDNKALVEAMFADTAVIVYDKTIGGAGSRVNGATGMFASDEQLAEKIVYMLDHHREFTPREWALANTGSAIATKLLDDVLRHAVTAGGGRYTTPIVEKTNAPNLAYKDPACRADFAADYEFILGCQRASSRS